MGEFRRVVVRVWLGGHRSHAFGDRSAQKMTAPKGGLGSPGRFRNVPQLGEARARGRRLATHDEINAGVEVLIHSHKDGVRQPRTIDQKRGTSDPLLNRRSALDRGHWRKSCLLGRRWQEHHQGCLTAALCWTVTRKTYAARVGTAVGFCATVCHDVRPKKSRHKAAFSGGFGET